MLEPPPNAWLKCSHTPTLTTTERTKVIDSEARTGKRLSRSGGTEYAVPIASAERDGDELGDALRDRQDERDHRARDDDPPPRRRD